MADKIIKCKVDVTKFNKDYFFTGEKGIYANFTILFNEEQDGYGNNGMILQDVPSDKYKADKSLKGNILGNCKVFPKVGVESAPGTESGTAGVSKDAADDLPF